jgi:hypothetical protein
MVQFFHESKITFFVRSGLIQAQGNHYHEFATKDFPALLSIMHHLYKQRFALSVLGSTSFVGMQSNE